MHGIRREDHHYTREQVVEHLRDALAIVDELTPPDDLRQITFTQASNMLSAKSINIEAALPGGMLAPKLGR